MNLMISLAVGDVNELRANAEERLLKIKARHEFIKAINQTSYKFFSFR
jgi:hypothetical protein